MKKIWFEEKYIIGPTADQYEESVENIFDDAEIEFF